MNHRAEPRKLTKGQRRSKRLPLQVPVHVYGWVAEDTPFRDFTHTLSVNAYGALLALSARVKPGQSVLLVNRFTKDERECRVVYVGAEHQGRRKVGVEFLHGAGDFWHVSFPKISPRKCRQ